MLMDVDQEDRPELSTMRVDQWHGLVVGNKSAFSDSIAQKTRRLLTRFAVIGFSLCLSHTDVKPKPVTFPILDPKSQHIRHSALRI